MAPRRAALGRRLAACTQRGTHGESRRRKPSASRPFSNQIRNQRTLSDVASGLDGQLRVCALRGEASTNAGDESLTADPFILTPRVALCSGQQHPHANGTASSQQPGARRNRHWCSCQPGAGLPLQRGRWIPRRHVQSPAGRAGQHDRARASAALTARMARRMPQRRVLCATLCCWPSAKGAIPLISLVRVAR